MTATEFRNQHGDPTTWTDHDFDVYQDLADHDAHTTAQPDEPLAPAA